MHLYVALNNISKVTADLALCPLQRHPNQVICYFNHDLLQSYSLTADSRIKTFIFCISNFSDKF